MHDGETGIGEALVDLDHALDALGRELLFTSILAASSLQTA
jgi:hypothetical protein